MYRKCMVCNGGSNVLKYIGIIPITIITIIFTIYIFTVPTGSTAVDVYVFVGATTSTEQHVTSEADQSASNHSAPTTETSPLNAADAIMITHTGSNTSLDKSGNIYYVIKLQFSRIHA